MCETKQNRNSSEFSHLNPGRIKRVYLEGGLPGLGIRTTFGGEHPGNIEQGFMNPGSTLPKRGPTKGGCGLLRLGTLGGLDWWSLEPALVEGTWDASLVAPQPANPDLG